MVIYACVVFTNVVYCYISTSVSGHIPIPHSHSLRIPFQVAPEMPAQHPKMVNQNKKKKEVL